MWRGRGSGGDACTRTHTHTHTHTETHVPLRSALTRPVPQSLTAREVISSSEALLRVATRPSLGGDGSAAATEASRRSGDARPPRVEPPPSRAGEPELRGSRVRRSRRDGVPSCAADEAAARRTRCGVRAVCLQCGVLCACSVVHTRCTRGAHAVHTRCRAHACLARRPRSAGSHCSRRPHLRPRRRQVWRCGCNTRPACAAAAAVIRRSPRRRRCGRRATHRATLSHAARLATLAAAALSAAVVEEGRRRALIFSDGSRWVGGRGEAGWAACGGNRAERDGRRG